MFESYENAAQIAVLLLCVGIAVFRAVTRRNKEWFMLAFFLGSMLMGDLYWQAYMMFLGETPQISIVSDISWDAAYIFAFLLLWQADPEKPSFSCKLFPWLGPAFTAAMGVYYMRFGKYVDNVIVAVLMGLLLYCTLRGLLRRGKDKRRFLYAAMLLFIISEYGMWTASCFFEEDSLRNPYFAFDILQTLTYPLFLPAVKKAVTA